MSACAARVVAAGGRPPLAVACPAHAVEVGIACPAVSGSALLASLYTAAAQALAFLAASRRREAVMVGYATHLAIVMLRALADALPLGLDRELAAHRAACLDAGTMPTDVAEAWARTCEGWARDYAAFAAQMATPPDVEVLRAKAQAALTAAGLHNLARHVAGGIGPELPRIGVIVDALVGACLPESARHVGADALVRAALAATARLLAAVAEAPPASAVQPEATDHLAFDASGHMLPCRCHVKGCPTCMEQAARAYGPGAVAPAVDALGAETAARCGCGAPLADDDATYCDACLGDAS